MERHQVVGGGLYRGGHHHELRHTLLSVLDEEQQG